MRYDRAFAELEVCDSLTWCKYMLVRGSDRRVLKTILVGRKAKFLI